MSAVSFNDQETFAGHKIGISTGEAYFLTLIAGGLSLMNWYHMSNTLDSKLITPETNIIFSVALFAIAGCLAALEFPVTKSMITNYRLNGVDIGVFMQGILLAVIIGAAGGGGIYSNMADADKKDIRITSYETQGSTFEDLKQLLISERNIKRSKARKLKGNNNIQAAISKANAEYFRALAKLKMEQSSHQLTRPASGAESGSAGHWAITIFISLLCSTGVVFISAYLAVYYKPLVGKPALSLISKRQQEWILNPEDIRSNQYEIDVIGSGGNDYVKVEKQRPNQANNTPSPITKNGSTGADQNRPTQNRPALDTTRVNGQNSVSERPLNTGINNGALSHEQYVDIRRSIMEGDLPPTVRSIKAYLRTNRIGDTDKTRSTITDKLLTKMKAERLLTLNPEQGKTNKIVAKYVLDPDYKVGQPATNQGGVINRFNRGEHMEGRPTDNSSRKPQKMIAKKVKAMTCKCPKCGGLEEVTETNPAGKVRSTCGFVYVAANNQADEL